MDTMFFFQTLSWTEACFRVLLALLFGFCLGYDRLQKNKPVDFRVYMIVATMTCLVAIMGSELFALRGADGTNLEFDLLRIIEGVLTGIGFLGAGAIIKSNESKVIIGTATGASIWGAGSVGLMIGFGLYGLAILGFAVLLTILVLFGFLIKTEKNPSGIKEKT